jgi:protocatechuate 3,4-dioxygenase beta subunit
MMNLLNKLEKKLNSLYSNKRFRIIALILAGTLVVFGYFLDRKFVTKEPSANQEQKIEIPQDKGCAPTSQDVEGPYFRPNAPVRTSIAPPETKGESLIISGTIYTDCKTPGAELSQEMPLLEVWQADNTGIYDTTTSNYWYRGTIPVDSQGRYQFETIRPGNYLDGGGFRPAHIHFRVTVPGYRPLTTQLYFKEDPYLGSNDSCGPCNSEDTTLITELKKEVEDGSGDPVWLGIFNIVLESIEPQALDTSNWQTYRSDEFGFEVKYP